MPTCAPELSGWAGRILDTLPDTGHASTGGIVSFFQHNLYLLNSKIYTDFTLSGECIIPDMTPMQSGIYEQVFYCNFLNKRALASLGTAAYDWIEIEGHDQSRIRKTAQTTVAQSYRVESTACKASLQELIDFYNRGQFTGNVGMVIYDQRGPNMPVLPELGRCIPCWDYFSTCNTVFANYYFE